MRAKISAVPAFTRRICVIAVAMIVLSCCPALAGKAITKVDVANKPDCTVISIQGNYPLSMTMLKSTVGSYLGFQFPFALHAKGRTVGIHGGRISNVRYSAYKACPALTRLVVNTSGFVEYSTEWSRDRRNVEITVWKSGVRPKTVAAAPKHVPAVYAMAKAPAAPVCIPMAAVQPTQQTEERRNVYRTMCKLGTTPNVAAEVAAKQPEALFKPVEAPVVASLAAAPVTQPAPSIRLSEESRKVYVAMRSLGTAPEAATRIAAMQPQPTTRVLGMTETVTPKIAPAARIVRIDTPATTRPARFEKRVSLNFLGADINDVLKALSVQSGENIVANKDVKGQVTVSLSSVTLEDALAYVAKLSGYGYKKSNGVYMVASREALQGMGAGSDSSDGGEVTTFVRLSYANPSDVEKQLAKFYPGLYVCMFTGKNDSSKDQKAATETRGLWGESISAFTAPQSAVTVLLSGSADTIGQAKVFLAQMEQAAHDDMDSDRAWFESKKKEIYRVKYIKANELASAIISLIPGVSVAYAPGTAFSMEAPGAVQVDAVGGSSVGGQGGADSSQSKDSKGDSASKDSITLTNETKSQTLIFVGNESDIKSALEMAMILDVRPPQIKIEAKVTSINKTGEKKLGLNWNWSEINWTESLNLISLPPKDDGEKIEGFDPVTAASNRFFRGATTFGAVLDALVTNGNAKVLASPNLVCMEGKPGVFFVGDEVTYIQRIETTATGQNILTDTKQVGVQLRVIGSVSSDGYVTLNLHPEVSVLKLNVDQGVSLPVVTRRFTDHVVRVKDGQTIVIGGLIRSDEIEEMSKVPILGDIPFLGNLFRHKSKQSNESEVVMFITASIIKD